MKTSSAIIAALGAPLPHKQLNLLLSIETHTADIS